MERHNRQLVGMWRKKRENKMVSKEVALRKILYRSVGQVSPRIVGTNIIPATLRNFNPLLLNILKHGIPLLDDGTFATVKEEFQRMLDAKIIEPREDYLVVATGWIRSSGFSRNYRKRTTMWRKRRQSIGQ